jgi:hypothetical protein
MSHEGANYPNSFRFSGQDLGSDRRIKEKGWMSLAINSVKRFTLKHPT